jgi:antirestriction protein ArdC
MLNNDIAQNITDKILTELEKGVAPWVKPWNAGDGLPYNPVTKNIYNGVNFFYLSLIQSTGEFGASNEWLTYKQAQNLGAQVRKGAKGVNVIFYKPLEVKDKATGDTKKIPMLKAYTVFNRDMIDGLPDQVKTIKPEFEIMESCEQFIINTRAKILHGGGRACYIPSLDQINLPEKVSFNTSADYYATAYHELIHYTGAEKRLNRLKGDGFGSESYAFEELIAELGASMLCAYNGINAQLQHASYINSWIKALKNDKKFIISASAKAQKAVNYLLNNKIEGEAVDHE